jgi:thiosulfate/3-mercaptopyruvate sulfurtransferase
MSDESPIQSRGYSHPEVLVSTEWVAGHLADPGIRLVESNEDPLVYPSGHLEGAVEIDWTRDLNDPVRRDYIDARAFAALMERLGIGPQTTVVFYGDRNNWWAAYAYWVFQLFGHSRAKLMDGGRLKWQREGRPLTRELPTPEPARYPAPVRDDSGVRAFRDEVLSHVEAGRRLVDVRSPEEFSGERLHMPEYPNEGALRGGHIPGAANIPWARTVNEDGTFKNADQLRELYREKNDVTPDEEVIVYCRIGERSSHSWFVLTRLLGYPTVRNYDGSWTEWGNSVGVPIER